MDITANDKGLTVQMTYNEWDNIQYALWAAGFGHGFEAGDLRAAEEVTAKTLWDGVYKAKEDRWVDGIVGQE